ncbi:MAG: family 20 glycosylhydrolase [Candidatus Kapaibacterium sp.]
MSKIIRFIIIIFVSFTSCLSFAQTPKDDLKPTDYLVPYPQKLNLIGDGFLKLNNGYKVIYSGKKSEKLENYIERKTELINKLVLPWNDTNISEPGKPLLEINSRAISAPDINTDESYTLEISSDKILVNSQTDIGAMRAIETIYQLIQTNADNIYLPCLKIEDHPRFQWRGLMIDVCRHFLPKSVILRNLDAMAMVKMNVFHWHLSEDQGFRVECKTFPKLHEMGSDGQYFTHEDVKEIIKYANDRGIRVVPEFDIPGHSTSWLVGYPEYASIPRDYKIERHYGAFDPTFDPTKEETYEFFDKFFQEMCALFNDEYMHIGGDENTGRDWDSSKSIQEFKRANNLKSNHELQAYFNNRIQKILEKYGKKMIGWDEILSTDLPKSIVIHSWQGKQGMVTAAKNGYYSILSNGYYIDLCQSMVDHYYNDPLPAGIDLTDDEKKFILGGEATMWAELVDSNNVDTRIWSRTAAISEVLWSGRKTFGQDSIYNNEMMFERLSSQLLMRTSVKVIEQWQKLFTEFVPNQLSEKLFLYLLIPEPVEYYHRHKYTKYSQSTPLNRVVDMLTPDAQFGVLINNYIGKKLRGDKVVLPDLKTFGEGFTEEERTLIKSNPKLSEVLPLFDNINVSAGILKDLLSFEKGDYISDEKYNLYKDELTRIKAPVAELEIPYIDNLLKLLEYTKVNSK